jgi:cellulose synthase/poly-beta-1,6-N-acetylglucosamine synthase-like glycosyltransferase
VATTFVLAAAPSAQTAPADASPSADESAYLGLILFAGVALAVLGIALAVFSKRARAADRRAPASSPAPDAEPVPANSGTRSRRLGRVLSLRSSDVALEDVTGTTTEAAPENIDRILERVVEKAEEQQAMPEADVQRLLALVVEVADDRLTPPNSDVDRLVGRIVLAAEERSRFLNGDAAIESIGADDAGGGSSVSAAAPGSSRGRGSWSERIVLRRAEPDREELAPHYVSADTAPMGFAVTRSVWLAPLLLILFAGACAALVAGIQTLTSWYADAVAQVALMPDENLLIRGGSISFRPFFWALIVLLAVFAVGSSTQRLKFLLFASALYVGSVLMIDVLLARAGEASWLPATFSPVGGIAAGVAGLLAIVISVFARYRLPGGVDVSRRIRSPSGLVLMLAACLVTALALTMLFAWAQREYFPDLHLRFIGGLDSELVIFLLALIGLLYLAAALERDVKPEAGPTLSVAFLIPAFNEAHEIAATIQAIDEAAANYEGECRLYVVDNGSRDGTSDVAAEAIDRAQSVEGIVLRCWAPGKAHALNLGLSFVTEDVVVRIDADTLVSPSLLNNIVPWYWDPSVGGVSGLPLPKRSSTPRWLYPLRLIEVYYGAAFLRVAQTAADGVMVMPGLIASYRRRVIQELGGFAERINGEDADITMRIGRLGYRIITDPAVEVYTEVPADLEHLREQRQRWARGLFHMAGRNKSMIWMRQGARGLWILPWSIFNGSRRSLMIPILVCALTVELLDSNVLSLREISVVAGFIVGLQLIVIAVILLAHGRFGVLPFVPGYLVFRLFRAYVAFETLLTLRLKPQGRESGARPGIREASRRLRVWLAVEQAEGASKLARSAR